MSNGEKKKMEDPKHQTKIKTSQSKYREKKIVQKKYAEREKKTETKINQKC